MLPPLLLRVYLWQTPFTASMEAAVHLMKSKVVQSDKHRVGVTFFGTKKTSDIDVRMRRSTSVQQYVCHTKANLVAYIYALHP